MDISSTLLNIELLVRDSDFIAFKGFPIRWKYSGGSKMGEKIANEHGIVSLRLLPNRICEIYVLDIDGNFVLNATINSTSASHHQQIIGLAQPKKKYISHTEMRVEDLDGKPVANTHFEYDYLGVTVQHKQTDAHGKQIFKTYIGEPIKVTILKPDGTPVDGRYTFTCKRINGGKFRMVLPVHQFEVATATEEPTTSLDVPAPTIPSTCGIEYAGRVKCTRFNHGTAQHPLYWYGPVYTGTLYIAAFDGWSTLIANQTLTSHEKNVICIMSPNEGRFDSIQAYDRVILTVGAMQKTIMNSADGSTGELPIQLNKFKVKHPGLFQIHLANCGWNVQTINGSIIVSYNGLQDLALKSFLKAGCNINTYGHSVTCPAIESMIKVALLPEYISIQVEDFITRLRLALSKIPIRSGYGTNHKTYYPHPISKYIKSALSHATVLDQDVNAPAWVQRDFGAALNHFFTQHPSISQNPDEWGVQGSAFEQEITHFYGLHRGGTDMVHRFQNLVQAAQAVQNT